MDTNCKYCNEPVSLDEAEVKQGHFICPVCSKKNYTVNKAIVIRKAVLGVLLWAITGATSGAPEFFLMIFAMLGVFTGGCILSVAFYYLKEKTFPLLRIINLSINLVLITGIIFLALSALSLIKGR